MSNGYLTIVVAFLSFFCWSCATTTTTTSGPKPKKRSVKFLQRQLEEHHIDYDWLGTKAKIKFDSDKRKGSFLALIRMQKDSLIWIKLKKLNVEFARILITPGNIEILNRQESQYIQRDFLYLKREFGLDLSFTQLQDLLVGNPILHQQPNLISVISENKNVLKLPESQKEILKIFMNPKTFLIDKIEGSANQNAITIDYSGYELLEKQQIPMQKKVEIDSDDVGWVKLDMTFSKMVLNEVQKVGFVVPDSYEQL